MNSIWKFSLDIVDRQKVAMPAHSHLLTAQFQGEQLMLWALVDLKQQSRNRIIRIYGTGRPCNEQTSEAYLTSVQEGSSLIWHVFDGGEE